MKKEFQNKLSIFENIYAIVPEMYRDWCGEHQIPPHIVEKAVEASFEQTAFEVEDVRNLADNWLMDWNLRKVIEKPSESKEVKE